jgi:hypothetical protein
MSITTLAEERRNRPSHRQPPEPPVDSQSQGLATCHREAAVTMSAECEEVLVADPRGDLTPSEMVDQRLRTLLIGSPRSLHSVQREGDLRRMRGK